MPGEVMPFQRCDHALGRWFVGGHVGSQSNLSQGADWLGPACDLACGAERGNEGGFQIKASSKTEEPPQTFTRHQHNIAACPSHKRRMHVSTGFRSGASRMAIIGQWTVS